MSDIDQRLANREAVTVDALFERAVARFPGQDALVFPDARATYAELWGRAWYWARGLHGLGLRAGEHLGILMPNCPEFVECLLGAVLCGAVAVPINARNKAAELAYVIENADLAGLISSDEISEYTDFGDLVRQAFPALAAATDPSRLALAAAPRLRFTLMLGQGTTGFLAPAALAAAAARSSDETVRTERARIQPDSHCIMMYTSGTTAHPKGCPLQHGAMVRTGVAMNRSRYYLTEQDRFWTPLPMFHMSSILPMTCCFDAGAATLSMRRFEAGLALEMLEAERATIAFPSFPTISNDLIEHPDFQRRDLSAIRRLNNVAPPDLLRAFQKAFPQAVQTGAYGLTEVGGVISFNHPDEPLERRLTTCGVPFDGIEVRIIDPDTQVERPVGEPGEMLIRGYAVFDGYYRAPEKNAEAFLGDWFRSGDLCSVDAYGGITFHGRLKDMLKVGGENVAALEIESHLSQLEGVALAQVIGVPDARLGEVPAAYIECKPDVVMTADDVIAHCRGSIAGFKVPRHIRFVTDWPMSSTKVQKYRLREWFDAENGTP